MLAEEKWEHAGDLLPAYVNQTLDVPRMAAVHEHLASCSLCADARAEWDAIGSAARAAAATMPAPSRGLLDRVWLKIEQGSDPGERVTRWSDWLAGWLQGRGRRLALPVGAGMLAAAVAGILVFGLGGLRTDRLLNPFEPRQSASAPATLEPLSSLSQLSDYGTVSDSGEPRPQWVADAATAAALSGMNVLTPATLPARISSPPSYSVVSGSRTTFTFSVEKARAAAEAQGKTLPPLPADIDGTTLEVTMHSAVLAVYGRDATGNGQASADGPLGPAVAPELIVGQVMAPSVTSTGASASRIEQYLLSQPGISPELAAALKALGDPSAGAGTVALTMLPIPVQGMSAAAHSVPIQGVSGLAIGDSTGLGGVVLWQKTGIVYVVAGALSEKDLVSVADSLH